jgi:hypothetical protein
MEEVVMKVRLVTRYVLVLAAFGFLFSGAAFADEGRRYEVKITNITRGQVITPPILIRHTGSFSLFSLGEAASSQLATLAEEGDVGPLLEYLEARDDVTAVAVGGRVLFPGEHMTLELEGGNRGRYLTAAAMLAVTNDAFLAVRGARLPRYGMVNLMANAYDAGSEVNSESCAYIPGPPCGNHVHDPADAEGFVHIHAGIHGIGDLRPEDFDWRNPVAEIKVRAIR